MRIGVVTKWFDRGQPVVGRYLRSAFEELGHETFVLARPKKERGPRPGALDRTDVWDQPEITEASEYDIPLREYEAWVEAKGIEAVFCDQNYQFEELAALRRAGIRTVGRFVWEHFAAEHVDGALEAFEIVYSFTHAEQQRYRELGIESPRIQWGLHPELLEVAEQVQASVGAHGDQTPQVGGTSKPGSTTGSDPALVRLIYPGGFIGHRKPVREVVEAFTRTTSPQLRLLVTAQVERKRFDAVRELAASDDRVELALEDLPRLDYLRRFASCDVCVTPSRWEGLGLPLYEATAFGMPIVVNDNPPMNEVVEDGVNGLLVRGIENGEAKSGIPAYLPDVADLARALERLADPQLVSELAAGARRRREDLAWSRTVEGFRGLLDRLDSTPEASLAPFRGAMSAADATDETIRTPVPFVVGVGRSGTTMLRLMLDAHSQLTIPPETHFVPDLIALFESGEATPASVHRRLVEDRRWGDFHLDAETLRERLEGLEPFDAGNALRAFYELYAERQGKPRWGDKTPNYVDRMRDIEAVLPEARFIHLIRDGRDVALSRIKRALKKPPPVGRVARNWKRRVRRAQSEGGKLTHYLELRYEDLVLETEPTLLEICEFLELPFEEEMLTYHERAEERMAEMAGDLKPTGGKPLRPGEERQAAHALTRQPPTAEAIGRWRKRMDAADLANFEKVAGDLLGELGYEVTKASRKRTSKVSGLLARPADKARRTVGRLGALRRRAPGAAQAISPTERAPAPFVVGVTRSGTTLLRMMLDSHPQLAIPPESHFVPDLIEVFQARGQPSVDDALAAIEGNRRWGDFHLDAGELRGRLEAIEPLNVADALRAFYELYAEKQGKPRWGDKTPIYINRMLLIQRALPEARFIHLIRDGRDAALSRAKRVLTEPTPMPKVAERWKGRILRARAQAGRLPYYLELHYEDLVRDTEATLRKACEFIELPFDEEMLRYHERAEERMAEMARDLPSEGDKPLRPADHRVEAHKLTQKPPDPSRLGRWREHMSAEDQAAFEEVAGDLLEELGYEVSGRAVAGQR